MIDKRLIKKYNVSGPRYTSYPTVPYWDKEGIGLSTWKKNVFDTYNSDKSKGISIYIHLPYCESLCTFCGCHKRITKRKSVQPEYIELVLREWELYREVLGDEKPLIKEIHLGGGTPTFFSPFYLNQLLTGILEHSEVAEDHEFSFEGHPNNTTEEHLQTLYDLGFRRVSYGVQDYDPRVQLAINRIQPFENVEKVHHLAKEIGYTSISHDLVYGLPFQDVDSVKNTIEMTNQLKPDRIAYYSYAHVPWIKGVGQRGFDKKNLPTPQQKNIMYTLGKELFDENEYVEIGMDHFALKNDSMYTSMVDLKLHRNFMGYTTTDTNLMIGLGMSSISDSWTSFAQNAKDIKEYKALVESGKIPIFKGHNLNEEDLVVRRHILNLMCQFGTTFLDQDAHILESAKRDLQTFLDDELISIDGNTIHILPKGRPFVRNVCMCFDLRLKRNKPDTQIFSSTI